jgi:hypothetical protein
MARVVRFHKTGGPEVLQAEEVAVPPPGKGEVQISIKALGLNRAESMFRSGQYLENPKLPARLGYEAAGPVARLLELAGNSHACDWEEAVRRPGPVIARTDARSKCSTSQTNLPGGNGPRYRSA